MQLFAAVAGDHERDVDQLELRAHIHRFALRKEALHAGPCDLRGLGIDLCPQHVIIVGKFIGIEVGGHRGYWGQAS